jgi:hypothetical protein
MQFSKTIHLQLFSHDLKSMNVNFSIFRGQHNHQIRKSLKHCGQFRRLRVRNRFPPPASLKQLEDVLQEEWYKIPLDIILNLYDSILRWVVATLKAKCGPTPY